MSRTYDPWQVAHDLGLTIVERRLRHGRRGEYWHRDRVIALAPRMSHRESRSVLAHEVQHALAGDIPSPFGLITSKQETRARRATGRTVSAAQVMPTVEWDRRQGFVPIPELVGATEAATMLGVSRQRIAQLVDEGKLPARRAGNALVFARGTVEAYGQAHTVVTPTSSASGEVTRGNLAAAGAAVPAPDQEHRYTGGAALT